MTRACEKCQVPVFQARIKAGGHYKAITVERCEEGAGDLAIFPTLFADGHAPIAEVVCNGTSYRAHLPHGSVLSFTAQARERKR